MADVSDLEDLLPTADLRPLGGSSGLTPSAPGTGLRVAAGLLPGLALVLICVAAAYGVAHVVTSLSPLVPAVAIGAILANVGLVPAWSRAGTQFAAKKLLRLGVVLLGFQLAIGQVLRLGAPGLVVVIVVVATTFFGTRWLGARLGVSPSLSLLIATGFSICGASAIAAVEGMSDAEEEEVAFGIAAVTLCGSLAIGVLPLLAGPLGLHGGSFGAWVGASVHDVAQVVAAASTGGGDSLHEAVIVKLTRVVCLAPLVAGLTLVRRRNVTTASPVAAAATAPSAPPVLPLFVAGFLAAIAVRSSGILPAGWLGAIKNVEQLSLAAALVGLGTGVQVAKLRRLGGRPLLLALLSWLLVAVVAYVGVRLVGA